MIVAGDEAHAPQAARHETVEEAAPVNLSFREGDREARNAAPAVLADPDSRENGNVADDPVDPGLLVSGVEEEIGERSERAVAPGLQFLVHERGGPADLRRRQAFHPELCHDFLDIPRGHSSNVHLGNGQHHRARGPSPSLQRPLHDACG